MCATDGIATAPKKGHSQMRNDSNVPHLTQMEGPKIWDGISARESALFNKPQ